MKYSSLLIVFLFVFSVLQSQNNSKKELRYKPVNLEEAVNRLKKMHHDTTKQQILTIKEDDFLAGSHFGMGMWIRNNWGLWRGGELAKHFNSIGIYHPDDMSGIILTSYYRDFKEQDWRLNEQVKHCQDFWKKSNEHNRRLKTDTLYQNKIKAQQDSIKQVRLIQKQNKWKPGTKVSGYLGYQCTFIDLGENTKVEGTVIGWKDDKLLLHIDKYVEENKKKKVIKCNDIVDDIVLIEYHGMFRTIE